MGNDIVRTYVGVLFYQLEFPSVGRVSSNLFKRSTATATGGEMMEGVWVGVRCVGYVYIILKYYSLEHLFCYVYIYIHLCTQLQESKAIADR